MSLRQVRKLYGLTQAGVGELVGVSQQTVARWENSSSSEIPSRHLQDLALALGCRIDDLLQEKPALATPRAYAKAATDFDRAFGTARIELVAPLHDVQILEYPVTVAEANRIRRRVTPETMAPWMDVWSMDDRGLLIDSSSIASIELIHDDIETMPGYENPEVYEALLDERMQELLGPEALPPEAADEVFPFSLGLIERCRSDAAWWGRFGDFDDRIDPTRRIVVDFLSGERRIFDYCDDEVFAEFQGLVDELEHERRWSQGSGGLERWMLDIDSEGFHRSQFVRLGALRCIQFSRIGYERALERLLVG